VFESRKARSEFYWIYIVIDIRFFFSWICYSFCWNWEKELEVCGK